MGDFKPRIGPNLVTLCLDLVRQNDNGHGLSNTNNREKRAKDETKRVAVMKTTVQEVTDGEGLRIPELLSKLPFFQIQKKMKMGIVIH